MDDTLNPEENTDGATAENAKLFEELSAQTADLSKKIADTEKAVREDLAELEKHLKEFRKADQETKAILLTGIADSLEDLGRARGGDAES